jgi:hypothetical protein
MSYLNSFADAIHYTDTNFDKKDILDFLEQNLRERQPLERALKNKKIERMAFESAYLTGYHQLKHNCLEASFNFFKLIEEKLGGGCFLTVGDVKYNGTSIFNVTAEGVFNILRNGKSKEDMNAHVWITLPDLTVLDLTIISTLIERGQIHLQDAPENPVLTWREDISSKFFYHPIIVDKDFPHKVAHVGNKII